MELEGGGDELVTRRDTARTAAAGPGAAVAAPAVATIVGEAEVRVRWRRLAGPAGGVAVVEREGVARVEANTRRRR